MEINVIIQIMEDTVTKDGCNAYTYIVIHVPWLEQENLTPFPRASRHFKRKIRL